MSTVPSSEPGAADPALAAPTPERALARLGASLASLDWAWRCLALTAAYLVAGYAAAGSIGVPIRWPVAYLARQAQIVVLIAYLPLVAAFLLDELIGPRAGASALRRRLFSLRFAAELALATLAVHATLLLFVNLKQLVPAFNPRLWDSPLWRWDARLHLGLEPAADLHRWAGEHGWLDLLDQAYLLFFPAQVAVPLLFLLSARLRPDRGRFFFAYCLLWMAGSAVYVLWPSLGPVYYRPSRFLWMDQAPYAQRLQWLLIQDYARFRADPAYANVKLYYGVAALPSLHVGLLALFAIGTRRVRALAAALAGLTALTFVGSLALGWHYAIDGYAGALLALLCWAVAGRATARCAAGDA